MKVKILVVGLGNHDKKYELTRHNIGFMILDSLCDSEFRFEKRFNAEICACENIITDKFRTHQESQNPLLVSKSAKFGDNNVTLMKPQTFMNLSGEAVGLFSNYYKLSPENIWVIHDDIDIPFGEIRVRMDGSSAGHKGIESIIQKLGAKDFLRFRVGVKNEMLENIETENFVLQKFNSEEQEKLPKIVDLCIKEVKTIARTGEKKPKILRI